MKYLSRSLTDTETYAGLALDFFSVQKNRTAATLVGLYGNLGSGKTAFTQAVAKLLGVGESVTSPTFVIEKIYEISKGDYRHLIHIDAYRLEQASEMMRLGWDGIIADPANLILVEWPEKIAEIMPENHIKIHFTFVDETTREIEF
jgi:tRNA threonylcarbamoyladenosine biosynthesis protein TsaE